MHGGGLRRQFDHGIDDSDGDDDDDECDGDGSGNVMVIEAVMFMMKTTSVMITMVIR